MQRPLDEEQARAAVKAAFDAVDAADVRVNIYARDSGFLRWAVNGATTSGQVTDVNVTVSCAVGQKHASANVHGLATGDIAQAARRALEMAKLAPDDPEEMPSLGPASVKPVAVAWSDEPVTAEHRAAAAAACIAEAKKQGLVGAGFIENDRVSLVVATRAGFFGMHHATGVDMSTTARTNDGNGSGWASGGAVAFKDVDAAAAARIACDKALRSRNAKALEPAAVAGLSAYLHFDARSADEGHSPFTKAGGGTRVGEKMFGELTLKADPWSPLMPAAPFDGEGMPRPPTTFVDRGVVKKLAYSRYWAKKMGKPADASYETLTPTGPDAKSLDDLIAGLERGLLVTRLWYIRMLDPQSVTVTGLTRDGVFLVENGKIVGPVNNFRFNQSVLQLFADTEAYGAPMRVGGEGGDPSVAPALRAKKFHMASKSDAV